MITGLRSALLCDRFEQTPEGLVNFLGVHSSRLLAASRPGLVEVCIALLIELDEKATSGQVEVRAADYKLKVPFSAPDGLILTAVALPVMIVVQRPSPLTVTVTDDNRRGRTVSASWGLEFAPDAEVLGGDAAAKMLAAAEKEKARMVASLIAQPRRPG